MELDVELRQRIKERDREQAVRSALKCWILAFPQIITVDILLDNTIVERDIYSELLTQFPKLFETSCLKCNRIPFG